MGLAEFVTALQHLHEKAKKGQLTGNEQSDYDAGRNQLATAMLAAQKITVPQGGKSRDYLRAPKMIGVDLQVPGGKFNVVTVEVWPRGFAALVAEGLPLNQPVKAQMKLRTGLAVECEATPFEAKRQASNFKVSFNLTHVADADVEQVALIVYDEILAKLAQARR